MRRDQKSKHSAAGAPFLEPAGGRAYHIRHIDDAGLAPNIVAKVKDVTVRMCRMSHARLDNGKRDQGGAIYREIGLEEHGRQLIKRISSEIADCTELPRPWSSGQTAGLDLIMRLPERHVC